MALLERVQGRREEIYTIAAWPGTFNVRVFGSVVRGEDTVDSYVDFF
ncbi:hypothetical protein [Synechococcus sp. PCC 6312]|nr:hypothetical protein [Synechococcus sp. PCC 6312]AFY60917.1 hypothetical protein Syn6312_1770 [Synechococcus sp. PCC 6312]